jgi:excisionase family DNA binding protein
MKTQEQPLLITIAEASKLAHVGRSTAYRLANSEWPVVRIGRVIRIPIAQLQKWIEDNSSMQSRRDI